MTSSILRLSISRATAAALMVAFLAAMPAAEAYARAAPESFANLAETLLPSVVNISSTQVIQGQGQPGVELPQLPPGSPFEDLFRDFLERMRPEQQAPRQATSLGSGFIIDADGYVVTNYHVIAEAEEITVILQDNTRLAAKVVGRDKLTDLALLKVEAGRKLPALEWGDSEKTRVGDWVLAIGNPFGLGGTVTAGIISARARNINVGPYDDFIQTDASINRGNSGGPMFDMDGRVIGINTAIFSPSGGSIGIGFAVPSAMARTVIDQLRTHGRTRRGWLGVRIDVVTEEIAESLGMKKARGALVRSLIDDTAKNKIRPGDVIVSVEGQSVEEMTDLPRIIAAVPPGKEIKITVYRKGAEKEVTVKLGERELAEKEREAQAESKAEEGKPKATGATLGMKLAPMSDTLRERFELKEDTEGVVIVDVVPNGPASEKRLRPGDVIVEVSQERVRVPADVVKRVDAARKAGRKSVFLLVERQGNPQFFVVRVDEE